MTCRIFFSSVAFSLLMTAALSGQNTETSPEFSHETVRLFDSQSKPEEILAHALSPNGRLLAISVGSGNLAIVDLDEMKLKARYGSMKFSAVAFANDSNHLLGIGGFTGIKRIDIQNGTWSKVDGSPWISVSSEPSTSYLDLDFKESNGKLIVSVLGPTLTDGDIRIGDELVAYNRGLKPVRRDDSRGWASALGKSRRDLFLKLRGRANTWMQLRFERKNQAEPIEVCLKRHARTKASPLPTTEGGVAFVEIGRAFAFFSGDSATECSAVMLRDLLVNGTGAVSPNGMLFGWVSKVQGSREFCAEVYELKDGQVIASGILDSNSPQSVRFSPNSKFLMVGTRDSVEAFDIKSGSWKDKIALVGPGEADDGRIVKRKIPLGMGGLPGLRTSYSEKVYSKTASLSDFDVSPQSVMAIGSEAGELSLLYMRNKQRQRRELGERILKSKAQLVRFSPTGHRLVAYAGGNLHIFSIGEKFLSPN